MEIAKLSNVLKIFSGGEPTPDERLRLVKETLLMTLARATISDTNIKAVEVDTIRDIVKKTTGDEVSAADVRVAAHSELFERTSLQRALSQVSRKLGPEERAMIVRSLAEVIRSDVQVAEPEIAFFNQVAEALRVTPAELAGLVPVTDGPPAS